MPERARENRPAGGARGNRPQPQGKRKRPARGRHALPLFDNWKTISRRIHQANHLLVLLDFDGTLVGFKRRPEEVRLDLSMRRVLALLAKHPRVNLGFISGRRRADLKGRVRVPGARYWGLHGWEGDGGIPWNPGSRQKLVRARGLLSQAIHGLPGIWIEDKQASLVLHYREAPISAARRAIAAARKIAADIQPPLKILAGKKILELMTPELEGKGAAVRRLASSRGSGTLAIYAGDDTTDESAFAALRKGLTIHVGENRDTQARYRLRDPEEVHAFLDRVSKDFQAPQN
ncbi:MAG TPA: trehalose-phosphatase [Terriglobia bacterium]|nr:trehalose-phosphatase [Terriglobia bacterium]